MVKKNETQFLLDFLFSCWNLCQLQNFREILLTVRWREVECFTENLPKVLFDGGAGGSL